MFEGIALFDKNKLRKSFTQTLSAKAFGTNNANVNNPTKILFILYPSFENILSNTIYFCNYLVYFLPKSSSGKNC